MKQIVKFIIFGVVVFLLFYVFTKGTENTIKQKLIENPTPYTSFDVKKYPNYYTNIDVKLLTSQDKKNIEQLEKKPENNAFIYSHTDARGRTKEAMGIITSETIRMHEKSKIERPVFKSDANPSGWQKNNPKIETGTYRGYLYNRSHLIAWSLGGSMERNNLITGTRSQNVGTRAHTGGMAYLETKIRKIVKAKPKTRIYYDVTPVYVKEELIPRGVYVKAYSINDNGKTINEMVYVFNNQENVTIDYATGKAVIH